MALVDVSLYVCMCAHCRYLLLKGHRQSPCALCDGLVRCGARSHRCSDRVLQGACCEARTRRPGGSSDIARKTLLVIGGAPSPTHETLTEFRREIPFVCLQQRYLFDAQDKRFLLRGCIFIFSYPLRLILACAACAAAIEVLRMIR